MAYSSTKYIGDGSTTDFLVAFDYLDQDHVKVRVDKTFTFEIGSLYKMTWLNSTTVRVQTVSGNDPAPIGADIEFLRETPIDAPVVVFGGGASLSSENLNKNSEYLTFALQEASDTNQEFTKLYLGSFNVFPTSDNDGDPLQVGAVIYYIPENALYYYSDLGTWIIGESTLAAQTFATAAQASASASAVSAAAALVSQNAAAVSQSAAASSQSAASSSASSASASATAANGSAVAAAADAASTAADVLSAVAILADTASERIDAQAAASAASSSATVANLNASSATASASSASASASAASSSADSASTSASNAAGSAATATTKAGEAAASAAAAAVLVGSSALSGRNLIINGSGCINQRGYVSGTATVGANNFTFDRWFVVTSGQSLTFTGTVAGHTMTAPAGGVSQVIEGRNIVGGTYVINWTGTATCTVGGVARAKGDTFTLTANTNTTVTFSSGTFTDVQLEVGSVATPFERVDTGVELAKCQRYYWRGLPATNLNFPSYAVGAIVSYIVSFASFMRVAPAVGAFLPGAVLNSCTFANFDAATNTGARLVFTSTAVTPNANVSFVAGNYCEADAELVA